MPRLLLTALAVASLAGCATDDRLVARHGPTPADILALAMEWWPDLIARHRLDPTSQPLAIRDLRCRLAAYGHRVFMCSYTIDYGKNGEVSGTIDHERDPLGQDKAGRWGNVIVVS